MEPTLHNILKASTAAKDHAQRLVEYFPEHSSALNRFEEEVRQVQKGLILRIRPERYRGRQKNQAKAGSDAALDSPPLAT